MKEYNIKRIGPGHLRHIKTLFEECFNRGIDQSFINRKFDTIGFGASYVGFMAFDSEETPAAYYGVFPVRMLVNGKQVLAAQSGDTMTSPKHQRKGLFTKLAGMTYDLCKEEGIAIVFGFPNHNSFPGFERKLNWKFWGDIFEARQKFVAFPVAAFVKKYNFLPRLFDKWVQGKLKRLKPSNIQEHISRFNPGKQAGIVWDEDYYKYKKFGGGEIVVVKGFVMWVKVEGALMVGDVVPFSEERMGEYQKTVKFLARKLGCHMVLYSLTSNHSLYKSLSNAGLSFSKSLPVGGICFAGELDLGNIVLSRVDLDTF